MASDGKRLSLGARVATPRVNSPVSGMSMDAALARCIGAKIKVQTSGSVSKTITGYIFAASPSSPFLTLTPSPVPASVATSPTTSYTVVPISSIQSFTLQELPPSAATTNSGSSTPTTPTAPPRPAPLPVVDNFAVQNRLNSAIAKLKEEEAKLGKGVTSEAQAIFNGLDRTMPCRWDGQRIIVLDSVVIEPPYGPQNCKAGQGVAASTLPRIKKVLEAEKKKIEARKTQAPKAGISEKKGG